jgi:hypothetical protein
MSSCYKNHFYTQFIPVTFTGSQDFVRNITISIEMTQNTFMDKLCYLLNIWPLYSISGRKNTPDTPTCVVLYTCNIYFKLTLIYISENRRVLRALQQEWIQFLCRDRQCIKSKFVFIFNYLSIIYYLFNLKSTDADTIIFIYSFIYLS